MERETRFTPWEAREYASPRGRWYVRDANNRLINYPMSKDDALLLAAGPDMTKAIEAAIKCSDALAEKYEWERVPEAQRVYEMLTAALSKAIGEGG